MHDIRYIKVQMSHGSLRVASSPEADKILTLTQHIDLCNKYYTVFHKPTLYVHYFRYKSYIANGIKCLT
jgi:hypothetical protein